MKPGESILTLMHNMQRLNSELAALLKTFEKLAGDLGYRNMKDSSVTKDCSYAIGSPSYWTPPWLYRVLHHKTNRDDVLMLNIALDNPDDPDSIEEPLVLAARFQYKKGAAKNNAGEWDAWDLWFHAPGKQLGRLYTRNELGLENKQFLENSEWTPDGIKAMEEISFLAIPLASVTNSQVLHEQVIKKLV